jgi:hypothetical protein
MFPQNYYFTQTDKMNSLLNPLSSFTRNSLQDIYKNKFPITETMSAIDTMSNIKSFLPQLPVYQSQISIIMDGFLPSKTFLSAIDISNSLFSSLSTSSIFDAVSSISKNMSTLQAITKLNAITPHVDLIDFDISITKENEILLDNKPVSRDEIAEIVNEFVNLSIEKINEHKNITKWKSKIGKLILTFLWFVIFNLTLQPLLSDIFEVFREYLGINKILEKIDIKSWAKEKLFNNSVVSDSLDLEDDNTEQLQETIETQEPK